MASEGTKNFRALLLGMLAFCVVGLAIAGVTHRDGDGQTAKPSASPSAQEPVIDSLCSLVASKVKGTADPQKYSTLCTQARRARDNDQSDVCASKLRQLGDLLNKAKIASIPGTTIANACWPARLKV